uniref:uncharacterized protein LOC113475686 n=1 Tax=Ciona intestinalis TaxID=7719 RepID=UPI0002B8D2A3|nr:uncharacterized protein LOC113475686 [Ciona intestinalis]|eukprot:XP_026695952.1 uncharacterized protein LOC113475686 [Ciona intestinalis]
MKNMGVVTLWWLVVVWLFISQTDASFNSYNFNNGTFLYTCGVKTHFFTEAVELCEQANAQLAVIKTKEMFNAAVQAVSTNCSSIFQFRIGLRKNASTGNEYRWLDGSRFDSQQVGGRIITNVSTDACLAVLLHNGVNKTLQAVSCTVAFNVLCYRSPTNNNTTNNSSTTTATSTITTTETAAATKSDNGTTTQTPTTATSYNVTSTTRTTTESKATTEATTTTRTTTASKATTETTTTTQTTQPIATWLIVVIALGGSLFLFLILVGIFCCCWWKKQNNASGLNENREDSTTEQGGGPTHGLEIIEIRSKSGGSQGGSEHQSSEQHSSEDHSSGHQSSERHSIERHSSGPNSENVYDFAEVSDEASDTENMELERYTPMRSLSERIQEAEYGIINQPKHDPNAYSTLYEIDKSPAHDDGPAYATIGVNNKPGVRRDKTV